MGFYTGINEAIGTIQFKLKHGLNVIQTAEGFQQGLEMIKQAQFALEILEDVTAFDICCNHEKEETALERIQRIKQVDDKGFYLYPDEPENQ